MEMDLSRGPPIHVYVRQRRRPRPSRRRAAAVGGTHSRGTTSSKVAPNCASIAARSLRRCRGGAPPDLLGHRRTPTDTDEACMGRAPARLGKVHPVVEERARHQGPHHRGRLESLPKKRGPALREEGGALLAIPPPRGIGAQAQDSRAASPSPRCATDAARAGERPQATRDRGWPDDGGRYSGH